MVSHRVHKDHRDCYGTAKALRTLSFFCCCAIGIQGAEFPLGTIPGGEGDGMGRYVASPKKGVKSLIDLPLTIHIRGFFDSMHSG